STTRCASPARDSTLPRLPLSRPAITMTSSPVRILFMVASSEDLRGQRHDLHELLGAQLARERAEDAGADGLQLGVEQHSRVAVELDQRAILAADAFGGANHHSVVDLALFDATARGRFLDGDLDDVTHAGVAALGAAEHLDAHHGFRTRVVSNIESRLRLNHLI